MRNHIKYIFYLIIIINSFGISQTNLVYNSSFKNHTPCTAFMLQWYRCIGCLNCNENLGNVKCGTRPLSYNPVPLITGMGFCNPYFGYAMMSLACYNLPFPKV